MLIENRISYFEDIYFLTMSKVRICTARRVIACAMCEVHPDVRMFTVDMYYCAMFTVLAARTCSVVRWVRYLLPRGHSLVCKVYVPPDERIFTAVRDIQYLLLRECDVYSVLGTSCCKDMYCCAMCTVSTSERILLL